MDDKNQLRRPIMLIADDHDDVRALLHKYVSSVLPVFHIMEAVNGEEAVNVAFASEPDVILMDINMPRMNGLEATRRIKAAMLGIRVVIITFDENACLRDEASLAGASAYILKSDIVPDLIPVLRNMLSTESKTGRGNALTVRTPVAEG